MRALSRSLALALLLGLLGSLSHAQSAPKITLTWAYTQNTQRPATSFVLQRCLPEPAPSTACVMGDLVGATAIPVTQLTYVDSNIILNQKYCYQLAAADAAGRSLFTSPPVCNGIFNLNVPTALGALATP